MFCEHCGAEINNSGVFCSNCGQKTTADNSNKDSDGNPFDEIFSGGTADDITDGNTDCYSSSDMTNEESSEQQIYNEIDNGQIQNGDKPAPAGDFIDNGHNVIPSYQEPKSDKNGIVIGLIAIIIVLVITIAGGLVWYFTRGDKDTVQDDTRPSVSESDSAEDAYVEEPAEADEGEDKLVPVTGNTRILDAYDETGIFGPEKLYNDIDYYICYNIAALYSESGGYGRGQIAQLDLNDIVTVKGAMKDSNWVYVYCKELDIYGWIEPSAISPDKVDRAVGSDKREVVYYSEHNCSDELLI